MAGQITAMGVGLNIQCASVVVLCEPQFTPAIEDQAISRCYRMGQVNSVQAYRLVCVDTIDERVVELLEKKREQFDTYADKSALGELSISEQDLKDILAKEKQRLGV